MAGVDRQVKPPSQLQMTISGHPVAVSITGGHSLRKRVPRFALSGHHTSSMQYIHCILGEISYLCTSKEMGERELWVPSFTLYEETMLKENEIAGYLRELLNDKAFENCFLLDFKLYGNNKLEVILDSDTGLKFEDCQRMSRRLEEKLDESLILGSDYLLEVSSPGVDRPLELLRQYPKHIGRKLKVRLKDGTEAEGVLTSAESGTVILERKKGKSGNATISLPFEDIKEAFVKISFK